MSCLQRHMAPTPSTLVSWESCQVPWAPQAGGAGASSLCQAWVARYHGAHGAVTLPGPPCCTGSVLPLHR